ncbi:Endoplasmic reticulum oxidoreductin-1 [Penicillium tannophilum]|nr:Endoplasmic reticulum oxidoreductin-1 [Penicillium tannophilum]
MKKSWNGIPRTCYGILRSETERLWAFWLGLPVPPRQWKPEAPRSDDP